MARRQRLEFAGVWSRSSSPSSRTSSSASSASPGARSWTESSSSSPAASASSAVRRLLPVRRHRPRAAQLHRAPHREALISLFFSISCVGSRPFFCRHAPPLNFPAAVVTRTRRAPSVLTACTRTSDDTLAHAFDRPCGLAASSLFSRRRHLLNRAPPQDSGEACVAVRARQDQIRRPRATWMCRA